MQNWNWEEEAQSQRRQRPRGGKSNKRKKIRETFAEAFNPSEAREVPHPPDPEDFSLPEAESSSTSAPVAPVPVVVVDEEEQEAPPQRIPPTRAPIRPTKARKDFAIEHPVPDFVDVVFDIPLSKVQGKILISNKIQADATTVLNELENPVVFDLYKTILLPSRLVEFGSEQLQPFQKPESFGQGLAHFQVGIHRNEDQNVYASTVQLIQRLISQQIPCIAVSYIGQSASEEYIKSLREGRLCAIFPVIFVVFRREQKAILAEHLKAIVCFDDQRENVRNYQKAGLVAYQVSKSWNLHRHSAEAEQAVLNCFEK